MWVMGFHLDAFFLPQAALYLFVPFFSHAYLAVDLFFLISGFVICHAYGAALSTDRRSNWKEFAIKRFARLYPLFALTTLVMVIIHIVSDVPLKSNVDLSARALLLNFSMLHSTNSSLSWNYPGWSIGTESFAYAFFVFAAAPLIKRQTRYVPITLCFLALTGLCAINKGQLDAPFGVGALIRTIAEFTIGVWLYNVSQMRIATARWPAITIIVLCLLGQRLTHWDVFVVGMFLGVMLIAIHPNRMLASALNSRPLLALGAWSYSIYLFHAPMHYLLKVLLIHYGYSPEALSPVIARWGILATMIAVVGLSAMTYRYVEVPARRWIIRCWSGDSRSPIAQSV